MKKDTKYGLGLVPLGVIILIFTGWGIIDAWGSGKFIDGNQFCLDKLNTHYPEYNFIEARFFEHVNPPQCVGTYYPINHPKIRDGLRETRETEDKVFDLISEDDINYLNSSIEIFQMIIGIIFNLVGLFLIFIGIVLLINPTESLPNKKKGV